jgi:exopolyphosphatase/guanosine-5'-triphosphate,3'-diphosphate pyrophosphatase
MSAAGTEGAIANKLWVLRRWVSEHLGEIRHERRVSAIAASLVKTTSTLHGFSRTQSRMLRLAAVVHDVGRCVNEKDHPAVGARMLLRDSSLPLKKRQRRALAYLTLHHRGAVPDLYKDPILRSGDDAAGLRMVLAFLRAADTLDSRSLPSPKLAFRLQGRRLRITCWLAEDSAKARRVFSRRKKFRLLEEMLGCEVRLSIRIGQSGRRMRVAA